MLGKYKVLCFGVVLRWCVIGKISLPCVFGVSSSEKPKNMIKRIGFISATSCKIKCLTNEIIVVHLISGGD